MRGDIFPDRYATLPIRVHPARVYIIVAEYDIDSICSILVD